MDNKIKGKDSLWHYLEVNRGRYLCSKHGGFCDSSDGYAKECPLCKESENYKKNWRVNPIDRVLQVMKNLQSRSIRIIQILSGVTGLFGLFSFFQSEDIAGELKKLDWFSLIILAIFIILFLISFIFYLLSMPHMKTTNLKNESGFSEKKIKEWEDYIVEHLANFEWYHTTGTKFLAWSGGFLILFLLAQLIIPLI